MYRLFYKHFIQLIIVLSITLQTPFAVAYDKAVERRLSIGLRLFRTLLASDQNLAKKVNQNNQLNLLLVTAGHVSEPDALAEGLIRIVNEIKKVKIQGIPVNISIIDIKQLQNVKLSDWAGIYLVDKLIENQLNWIINVGISQQAIVYSPFEGDVEKGVTTGLFVGIRVLPFINLKTLKKSKIAFKPLVFRIAKIYED